MLAATNSSGTNRILLRGGLQPGAQALDELFLRHQERLRKIVRLRLDWRLRGRFSSAVLLEQVRDEASQRLAEFSKATGSSFFLWLRELTLQRIESLHLREFGAQAGESGRELHLYGGALPSVTAASMAAQLLGDWSANQEATRADLRLRLQGALNAMDALDREIIALRNFEELTAEETAAVLKLSRSAVTVTFLKAVKRLNEMLATIQGFNPQGQT